MPNEIPAHGITQPTDEAIDRVFRALGDPMRRAILEKLSEGPVSVSRLALPFNITLSAVMQHLQVLEECGLVVTEKLGRVRTCRMDFGGFALLQKWISDRRSAWERRLDRLGEILAESEEPPKNETNNS